MGPFQCWEWADASIGPMHEEKILGNTPKTPLAPFPPSLLKEGIPLVKINIFQRFKYR